ncbi:Kiwa anti-phage protein KwaB-like domain-containing protein [Ferrovum sp. JA12]|uniref:Kiwa anti-phage protein KwaB-like domain-containing protein n=1 Tax=Ferrovum sp. JA12 TaxID=1356299 RepID=UPI0009E76D69
MTGPLFYELIVNSKVAPLNGKESNIPNIDRKIRFNQAEDKIVLDSKVSKDLFIKLLMDNFLTSALTNYHDESVAKDRLDLYLAT